MLMGVGCYLTVCIYPYPKSLSLSFDMSSLLQTDEREKCVTLVLFRSDGFDRSVLNNLSPSWDINT